MINDPPSQSRRGFRTFRRVKRGGRPQTAVGGLPPCSRSRGYTQRSGGSGRASGGVVAVRSRAAVADARARGSDGAASLWPARRRDGRAPRSGGPGARCGDLRSSRATPAVACGRTVLASSVDSHSCCPAPSSGGSVATVPLLAGGAVAVAGALPTVTTAVAVTSLCPLWPRGGRSRHSSGLVDALLDACDAPRYTPAGRRPSPASRCLWRPLCIGVVRGRLRAAPSPGEGARRRLPLCPCGAVAITGIPLAATRSSDGTTSLRLNGVVRG